MTVEVTARNGSGQIRNTSNGANGHTGVNSNMSINGQKQISCVSSRLKADQIEILEAGNHNNSTQDRKHNALGWICCAPCIWLRTSATVHKISITAATLIVTSLLVASPILFLISTAPSQLPRDCYSDDEDCMPTSAPPPECIEPACRLAASSIQARMNWKIDPCKNFKDFSCSSRAKENFRIVRSAQEAVDLQIKFLLQHNTTTGPFRKLGRLYGSCLRQKINSTTIFFILDKLGGYLPIGTVGPSSISTLLSRIYELGPTPLIDIYYDLSYGRRPQVMLIISEPNTNAPILQNKIRWLGPKAPPYRIKENIPVVLNELIDNFLPKSLGTDQKQSEKGAIINFIVQLNKIRAEHVRKGFWDSSALYNFTLLGEHYPFFNWTNLIPSNWTGPIVVRSSDYLKSLQTLLSTNPTRVAHNSLLLLFALSILPQGYPDPLVCTKATMWALPEITSALFLAQHSRENIENSMKRTEIVFESLKAHLKRAPSLKGAALVKLSALKLQSQSWPIFDNISLITKDLEKLEITSDNWFENILNIYEKNNINPDDELKIENHAAWAFPIMAKIFYDTLSHSIVVPLSVILVPYFDEHLPPYLQYASVGVAIAKEILRSITKTFDDKAMRCVPKSVNIFSNHSRMDILIHSGGMQISYHSMLSLTGPLKGMARLPGLNLTPTQIYFLVSAQDLCADSDYTDVDTDSDDFQNILGWLIAQGGSAIEVFKCPSNSIMYTKKTCNVL